MSCASDFLRRITGAILVLVVAVLGCLIVASAASAEPPPGFVQAYGYDAPDYDQPVTYTATQRGPPTAHVSTAVSAGQRAVDLASYGALARSISPSTTSYTTYVSSSLARVDNSTGATARPAVTIGGNLSALQRGIVAANAGSRLLSPGSLADEVANATGGVVKANKGGFTVNVPQGSRGITVRVMERGGSRTNYYRVSVPGKGTYTLGGETSTDAALTHMDIGESSLDDILSIIGRIQGAG